MEWVDSVDWTKMFVPDAPLLEIFVRATVMYLVLFLLFRFTLKRQTSTFAITDLLLILLIAESAQNGLIGDSKSVTDALIAVCVMLFWDYMLNWLSYRSKFVARLLAPPEVPLVKHGRMLRQNMKKELITEDELMSQLRLQGVDKLSEVKTACIEADGKMSVITYDKKDQRPDNDNPATH